MEKRVKLKQEDLKNIVKIYLKEQDEEEWVKISPQRFVELMSYVSYFSPVLKKLPEFKGKKIWVTGSVTLRNTPTENLTGVDYIEGYLDITGTKVLELGDLKVKSHIWDTNTPRETRRKRIEQQKKLNTSQNRREDDDWNLELNPNDGEAWEAHAVLEYFIDNQGIEVKTPEDFKRLNELNNILENLKEKQKEYEESGQDITDVYADIDATEEEIEELNKKMDVYNIYPMRHNHYGLSVFEIIGVDDFEGEEFCVGTPDEMEDAAKEYASSLFDEGIDNFNRSFIESHVDEDEVAEYLRDYYDDDIRSNPEAYFDDDDYKLSEELEKRIEEIDELINELNNRLENLEDEVEEPSEVSDAYDKIQERIDELEAEKEEIESEEKEVTEEMIDEKLEEKLDEVRRAPLESLEEMGVEIDRRFINKEELVQDMVNQDGVGIINGYDGDYTSVTVKGDEYYVMRIN